MRATLGLAIVMLIVGCRGGAVPAARAPLTAICPLDPNPGPALIRTAAAGHLGIEIVDASGLVLTGHSSSALLENSAGERQRRVGSIPLSFDSLPPRRYVVRTNALGYNTRVDSVRLSDTMGVLLRLPVSLVPLDACGGYGVPVRGTRPDRR